MAAEDAMFQQFMGKVMLDPTLIMSGIAASGPTGLGGVSCSFAGLTGSCCTIRLPRTFLQKKNIFFSVF